MANRSVIGSGLGNEGAAEASKPLVFSPFPASSPDEADPAGSPGTESGGGEAGLGAYEYAVRGILAIWRMLPGEERAWHLEQARVAREWRDIFAKEKAGLDERLALLGARPTYERYDPEDTEDQRHKRDAAECRQLRALHEGQELKQDIVQVIRRCGEDRDVGEILAHIESLFLARAWHSPDALRYSMGLIYLSGGTLSHRLSILRVYDSLVRDGAGTRQTVTVPAPPLGATVPHVGGVV